MKKFLFILFFSIYFSIIFLLINFYFFYEIFCNNLLFYFFNNYFYNLLIIYPNFIFYLKFIFIISCFIFSLIILVKIFYIVFPFFIIKTNYKNNNSNNNSILIGMSESGNAVFLPISGLYQNILVIGSIGSGKTSSFLYPITSALFSYFFYNNRSVCFLILDVKGNYHNYVEKLCNDFFIKSNLIILGLNSSFTYNPLHKPNLKASILANRLKNILLLFSPEQTESFWLDKAEQVITEAIKLIRLYNNNYVTFLELHKLIMSKDYYNIKIKELENLFYDDSLNDEELSIFYSSLSFFEDDFFALDDRSIAIIKSEISRITNTFVSDDDISKIFCPSLDSLSFPGFDYCLKHNKIVVLDMNISQYKNLSKIIAAYLKIDFQSEVLMQLSKKEPIIPSCFICDEFHEYVTVDDAYFFSQSREAKCINIVSTQSYSSIVSALNKPDISRVLIQNLINKIWFRTDDSFTIEEIQKQLGKEDKEIKTTSFSENAKTTKYNSFLNIFLSEDSNISESYSSSFQKDFVLDSNFFTQELETFTCLAFLSNGKKILPPQKLYLTPYYMKGSD